jgi:hypothetical protein
VSTPDPVTKFLDAYDPKIAKLALSTRALVLRLVPEADEKVLRPWKTIAYGRKKKFCAISPHARWVNLQVHSGGSLPDPKALLEGTGKSMRHVKLEAAADLKGKPLADLIRAAAEQAGS